MISKTTKPEVCHPKACEAPIVPELSPYPGVVGLENDSGSSDTRKNGLINHATNLVIGQKSPSEVQLESTEVLEDVGAIESDDDSVFN